MSDERKRVVSIAVWAQMMPLGENQTIQVQVGTRKVVREKGLFKKEMVEEEEPIFEPQTKFVPNGKRSSTTVDINDLRQKIEDACERLIADGYEIHTIMPIISGAYNYRDIESSKRTLGATITEKMDGGGWGYGYSYTDGAIITAVLPRLVH